MLKRKVVSKLSYSFGQIVKDWYIKGWVNGRWVPLKDGGPFKSNAEAGKQLAKMEEQDTAHKSEPKKKQTRAELVAEIERLREENSAMTAVTDTLTLPRGVTRNGDALTIDPEEDEG